MLTRRTAAGSEQFHMSKLLFLVPLTLLPCSFATAASSLLLIRTRIRQRHMFQLRRFRKWAAARRPRFRRQVGSLKSGVVCMKGG